MPAGSEEIPFPPPFHVISPPRPLPGERLDLLVRGDYPARISVILPATNESVLLQRTVEQFQATLPRGGATHVEGSRPSPHPIVSFWPYWALFRSCAAAV